ncbi:MAG: VOC family protein [Pseudomonadota bacterium]
MTRFCRFDLRTTDAEAARAFYARLFGHERAVVWPLHEQALARGARPHWLGHVGVANPEQVAAEFIARGATRLGPARPTEDGGAAMVLRDPGGALLALSTLPRAGGAELDVGWHVLNTRDAELATTNYCELFGWEATDSVDLAALGAFRRFAWHAGGSNAGVIADIAGRPGVHPQWLFVFEVAALGRAVEITRTAGGVVLDPVVLPGGDTLFVCDDPQGAAFALRERRPLV